MSQSNNDVPVAELKPQTSDDIFKELSKDDGQESLDLTKPLDGKRDDKLDTGKLDDGEDEEGKGKKEEEEVDEIALLEEDLEEPDEEKLELTTPVRRREILAKYPNLFKDFPYLEKAYYREQQFTEILSTIDDAKQAKESHEVLQRYTEDMVERGNVSNVLKMIKDSNPDTFAAVVDNYMDHLYKVDQTAYTHVQGNLVKNIIIGMVEEARSSQDDDLRTAALLLNKWAFGSSKFTPPQKLARQASPEENGKESEIARREAEFNERQIDSAVSEVNSRVNNSIKGAIESNIDPNGTMSEYLKKNATRDAVEKISNLIERDTRFQKIVDKLWERAAEKNFSKDSQDEIRKAFLSKAKSLLAPVIKSARNEALKGIGKKVAEESNEEEPQREKIKNEPRLSSDKSKAKLDNLRGKSSFEALNALMGD